MFRVFKGWNKNFGNFLYQKMSYFVCSNKFKKKHAQIFLLMQIIRILFCFIGNMLGCKIVIYSKIYS